MLNSSNLDMEYLAGSQSHKHITVNNALTRLDRFSQLVIEGEISAPPPNPEEGAIWIVKDAQSEWQSYEGSLAFYHNGGFEFLTPKIGWQGFRKDWQRLTIFDGANWRVLPAYGWNFMKKSWDFARDDNALIIPERAMVFGVSSMVKTSLAGTELSTFSIGTPDNPQKFGYGIWHEQGGQNRGVLGAPETFWQETPLMVSLETGEVQSGILDLCLAYFLLPMPEEIPFESVANFSMQG